MASRSTKNKASSSPKKQRDIQESNGND
jgi:uncharacterized coiled-coil DUF342 family protein